VTLSSTFCSFGEAADSPKRLRNAALPSENGVAVWQETQNVSWSRAADGHDIHHVDLWSKYAAALAGFQTADEDFSWPNASVPDTPIKRNPAMAANLKRPMDCSFFA